MLDLIREIFKGAKWNTFLRRINYIRVTNSRMRNNHLRVTFSSQGTTFKKRSFKPNTLAINILSCFYIINSIDDEIEVSPEVVIKERLILLTDSKLCRFEINFSIDCSSNCTSSLTFILSNVLSSEQKLTIEITYLNIVIVCNCDFTSFCAESHQGEHFDEFAAECSSANHE